MKKKGQLTIKTSAIILFLVFLTIGVRLYRISNPVADWHAFRQADTASVTREFVKKGIDLLHPTYQDLSNIQSGKDNLAGYRMVEFPFINGLIAGILRLLPGLDLVTTSRFISVLFSAGTTVSLFYLVKRISGKSVATLSAITFALLPFSVYYGRTVLPEPAMLFFSTASLLFYSNYLDGKKRLLSFFLGAGSLALALLLKPFVAFLAPVFATMAILKYQKRIFIHLELVLFVILAFAPLYFWREWILDFPSGIPASDWLFNSNGIRLRPAWFRWLFWERLTKLILGYGGWMFIIFNVKTLTKSRDELLILSSWAVGLLIYLVVMATGNVQHDYYQVITLPLVSILVGRGTLNFYEWLRKQIGKRAATQITFFLFGSMLLSSWYLVRGYFNVNHWEYVKIGKIVDQTLPKDAKVIAPAFGDTIFLFQTNRTGWPIGFEIEDKIAKGATHYVSSSDDDESRELAKKYTVISRDKDYILIDLTKK